MSYVKVVDILKLLEDFWNSKGVVFNGMVGIDLLVLESLLSLCGSVVVDLWINILIVNDIL